MVSRKLLKYIKPLSQLLMFFIAFRICTLVFRETTHEGTPLTRGYELEHADMRAEAGWLSNKANQCTPRHSLAFLKTHKCASSTVQNIIFNYGWENNLTFVLPNQSHVFKCDEKFNASYHARGSKFHRNQSNLFAVHSNWDREEISKTLYPDAKFFTIIREPSEVYLSMFEYFALDQYYKMPLSSVLETVPIDSPRRQMVCLAFNSMACDMGALPHHYENPKKIRALTARTDDDFDLVMIAERFEESLVLLSELLCWPLEDMVYLRANQVAHKDISISLGERRLLETKLRPDYFVYNYFSTKFERLVEAYGREKMKLQVALLKKMIDESVTACGIEEIVDKGFSKEVHRYVARTNSPRCQNLVRKETDFVVLLKKRQSEGLV